MNAHVRTSSAIVGFEGEMGVYFLAERTDDCGLVELIVLQELQRLPVECDVDLADGIVQRRLGVALCYSCFQPGVEEAKAVTAFYLYEWSGIMMAEREN